MATTTEELVKKTNTASTPQTEQINAMYDAQKQAQMSQLESAYNQNLSNAQAAKDKIAPQYQQSANDLAVQFERNRRNYNQQALANGINTGTASQARLAQNNEYLRDFGQLRTAESDALTEAERGITDLKAQYQSAIAAAAAENDYKRAGALLQEYNNQYSRDMNRAQLLAQYGDFSMYAKLYGQETADKMASAWVASNPDLAYRTGQINAAQYKKMTGVYPAGYGSTGGHYYGPGPDGGPDGGDGGEPYNVTENDIIEAYGMGYSYKDITDTIAGSADDDARKRELLGVSDRVNYSILSGNKMNERFGLK